MEQQLHVAPRLEKERENSATERAAVEDRSQTIAAGEKLSIQTSSAISHTEDPHAWLVESLISHIQRIVTSFAPEIDKMGVARRAVAAVVRGVRTGALPSIDGTVGGLDKVRGVDPDRLCAAVNIQVSRLKAGLFSKYSPDRLAHIIIGACRSAYANLSEDPHDDRDGWYDPEPGLLAGQMRRQNPDKSWRGLTCREYQLQVETTEQEKRAAMDRARAENARSELRAHEQTLAALDVERSVERDLREKLLHEAVARSRKQRETAWAQQKLWLDEQGKSLADVAEWLRGLQLGATLGAVNEALAATIHLVHTSGAITDISEVDYLAVVRSINDFKRVASKIAQPPIVQPPVEGV